MKVTFFKTFLLLVIVVIFSSCEKEDDVDATEQELELMEKITVGEPVFTVSPGAPLNIYRVAWTGEKLWAITDIGGGDITQNLLEINPSNGDVVQTIPFNVESNPTQMFSLDYANGKLMDVAEFYIDGEQKYARTYDIETGEPAGKWNYNGIYGLYYYLAFDGTHYWGGTNFNCNDYNCQAIVKYDAEGAVVKAFEANAGDNMNGEDFPYTNDCVDLAFGGGHLWASRQFGGHKVISKLDTDLNILKSFLIEDGEKFGEAQYANEIATHIEYINGSLWIVDRWNNFYKTNIQ